MKNKESIEYSNSAAVSSFYLNPDLVTIQSCASPSLFAVLCQQTPPTSTAN